MDDGDCLTYGCMDPNASNYDASANADDGSCEYASGCVNVVCDGGSWQSEVSWEIYGADGSLFASGGAPYSDCLDNFPEDYYVMMYDSYGDGWNGNTIAIDGTSYELSGGASACGGSCPSGCTDPVAENYDPSALADDGSCEYGGCTPVTCDGGSWQGEVSWEIYDASSGTLFASGGAPYSDCLDNFPSSYYVMMYDSYGDGWNGNVITIGDDAYTIDTGASACGGDCPAGDPSNTNTANSRSYSDVELAHKYNVSLAFYEQRTARPEVKEFVDMSDYRGTICDGDDCSLDLPAGGYILQYDVCP